AEGPRCGRAAPRIVLGWLRAAGRITAAAATEPATATAAAAGLVDLRGRVAQRRPDLVDLDLDHGALLTLAGFEGALLEPPRDDHAGPAGQALGHVLGGLTPDVAPQEQRLAVLPLPALPVVDARGGRNGEVGHRGTGRRETQFRIGGQVSDDGDGGVTS